MKQHIQTGPIGAAPVLRSTQNHLGFGGVRFFYPEDDGGGQIGGGQGGQGDGSSDGGQGGQQQQQQQPVDPFATIDLDLLDDTTRAAVENARTQFQQVAAQAGQARDFQSRYDRLVAETQQQNGQQRQQQQQQHQPTFEEELEQTYITEGGMAPAQAKAVAKLNAKIFGKFSNRVGAHVDHTVGPIAANVAMQNATSMFNDVLSSSPRMQNPDVAERVWQAVTATVQQGGNVDPAMIESLSKIYYVDITEAQGHNGGGGNGQGQQFQQQQFQPRQQIVNNGSTRYTFPGAGHLVRPPLVQRPGSDVDPETASAISATKAAMTKSFHWNTQGGAGKVGRGGAPTSGARR